MYTVQQEIFVRSNLHKGQSFVDAHNYAHYALYDHAYFVGLIFKFSSLTTSTTKIGSLKNYTVARHAHKK